jgi:CheY-like chemotaxis protein
MSAGIVLVIDDDEDVRDLLSLIAREHGFDAWQAPDCREGMEQMRRAGDRLALVLLDYFMPGVTPDECCRAVLALAGPRVEVVLVTAAFDPAERARAIGLRHWVGKPFELDSIEWIWRLAARPECEQPATT